MASQSTASTPYKATILPSMSSPPQAGGRPRSRLVTQEIPRARRFGISSQSISR